MAEVLAVAGGIAAIVRLAGCGKKLARVLHRFSRDAMDARDSVQRFANQVGIFCAVIEAAQQTIFWYCRDNPESLLVTYINSSGLLASINLEAGIVRQHLRDIRNQVLHMKSTFVFWASIMWGIKKSSFKEVLPEMESIKTSLILLLSTTRLESLIVRLNHASQPDEGLVREIARLKRTIRHLKKALEQLRLELSNRNTLVSSGSESAAGHDFTQPDPLMRLARSMYRREAVPQSPPGSPQTSSSSSERRVEPWPAPSHPSDPTRTKRETHRRNQTPDNQLQPRERTQIPSRDLTVQCASSRSPSRSTSICVQPSTSSTNLAQPAVYSTIHKWEDNVRGISGYIKSPQDGSHWKSVTAKLAENLDGNIISVKKARELGLEVEQREPGAEDVMLDFGTGPPERSVGRVTLLFKWRAQTSTRDPELTITCEVCQNTTVVGLVLGVPFIEER